MTTDITHQACIEEVLCTRLCHRNKPDKRALCTHGAYRGNKEQSTHIHEFNPHRVNASIKSNSVGQTPAIDSVDNTQTLPQRPQARQDWHLKNGEEASGIIAQMGLVKWSGPNHAGPGRQWKEFRFYSQCRRRP